MKKQIKLQEKIVEYTLNLSRRARRMRLTIYSNGNLVITAPQKMNLNIIERYIKEKSRWVIEKLGYFKNNLKPIFKKETKEEHSVNRNRALVLAQERIAHFNKSLGFKYNRITIRNQRTRWGSCSSRGNLNFNYKIIFLSPKLADYIIVHELCHLKEFNHSHKFWNLVAKLIPDYLSARNELKKCGLRFI